MKMMVAHSAQHTLNMNMIKDSIRTMSSCWCLLIPSLLINFINLFSCSQSNFSVLTSCLLILWAKSMRIIGQRNVGNLVDGELWMSIEHSSLFYMRKRVLKFKSKNFSKTIQNSAYVVREHEYWRKNKLCIAKVPTTNHTSHRAKDIV